ncbi:MAG: UbiA family prenyltransferase [Myxococcales bacterium]|nr:UbiA family prenyltransferase [Myxococcales bacterium]
MALSWTTALRLGRVSNLPTVWTNIAAGWALSGAPWHTGVYFGLSLAMSALYVGGMYLNDAFDAAWDRVHRPERPIARGEVPLRLVLKMGLALLATGVVLVGVLAALGLVSAWALLFTLVLASLIVYYDLNHKQNAWGPLVMGLCRVGVYTVAGATSGFPGLAVWVGASLLLGHLVGLTYVAKHETRGQVVRLSPLLLFLPALVAAMVVAWAWLPVGLAYASYTVAAGLAPALGWGRSRPNPGKAVPALIAAISLLDAVFVTRAAGTIGVAACVAAFGLTRFWQRHVPGT